MKAVGFAWSRAAGYAVAALVLAAFALAQPLRADDGDPASAPARAARLSSVDGQVRLAEGGQTLSDNALRNTPVFEGTQLVTADDGRAELQFDDGSVARLSPNGSLSLPMLRLTGETEMLLDSGLAYFELQGGSAQIKVRFADSVVTASGFTVFRLNLDRPGGELAVFSGNAHLERTGGLTLDLHGGESARLDPADSGRYTLAESIEPDSWDSWNSDRDQALTASAAQQTGAAGSLVSSNASAWNDLDANGNWYNVPGQGLIWSPYEGASPSWDPWGNGYWMWTPRFGYIWVSGDPWGYMPFNCGAWSYFNDFGWGWAPGMCNPWWGGGYWTPTYYGGGFGWFEPPRRPRHRPGGPTKGLPHRPVPVIAINRRPPGGSPGLPVRARGTPVIIAGHLVQPLRPLPSRPTYDHIANGPVGGRGQIGRGQPIYGGYCPAPIPGGGSVPVGGPGAPPSGGRSIYTPAPRTPAPGVPGYSPVPRTPAPGLPGYSPAPHPSAPPHTTAPAPGHSSFGGGSGGGGGHASSAPSAPSGGGGGGSSHSSGGGSHH
ncbi:MAG: FecR family protein [Terracidiphilus sp.]